MWMQFAIPLLQLLLKLLPFLYQIKVLRDATTLKELQRRFEAAIRKAEEGALDSTRLKEQHEANMDDLRTKHDRVWGTGATPAPVPTTPPPSSSVVVRVEPKQPKVGEKFFVYVSGLAATETPEIWVDKQYSFGVMVPFNGEFRRELSLNTGGVRSFDVKVKDQWVGSGKAELS